MRPALLALFSAPLVLSAQQPPATAGPADRHLALVRPRFSGERALETVAFMDHYVRWPGNAGFDSSIANVARGLAAAGYVEASAAKPADRLTYRVERYPLPNAAWEPLDASLAIIGPDGRTTTVLAFATNRNMIASNSFSTPAGGVEAELVRVAAATPAALDAVDVRGKIVLAGAIAYGMPAYTQPERNRNSIQFTSIPYDSTRKSWGIRLSYAAREQLNTALAAGPVRVRVVAKSRFVSPAVELAVVAEIRGSTRPDERFVYSAHVQEPGANDDASGVGTELEMARVAAELVKGGQEDPRRTITFLWGQENRVTARYIQQDSVRAKGIHWGISMDMTGEDTKKTGGTFLIEKMPDPSAIWTRGDDHHTDWGGGQPLREDRLFPHYFNDYLLQRCLDQARGTGWVVKTNPYEGGSDHVSYLNAKVPGVLFWHFTDMFYHTDGDRLEMVSPTEMRNTGTASLVSGLTIASADGATARAVVGEVELAALARLETERRLSADTLARGGAVAHESHILETWGAWYRDALKTAEDIEVGGASAATRQAIDQSVNRVRDATAKAVASLTGKGDQE
jgi:hypothetical protein